MTINVEDGSNVTDADAYTSIADADTFNTAYIGSAAWTAATDAVKELAIRRTTLWLDMKYHGMWRSSKYYTDQELEWPRIEFCDIDGITVDDDVAFPILADANAWMAIREVEGDDVFPVNANPGLTEHEYSTTTKNEKKKWAGGSVASDAKKYPFINNVVARLVHSGGMVSRG